MIAESGADGDRRRRSTWAAAEVVAQPEEADNDKHTWSIGGFCVSLGGAAQHRRLGRQSVLKIIDPIWTTAYIVRNHGYMIYDTLFALTATSRSSRRWSTSGRRQADRTFTLRDGLP
jgi:hypothetical protein